jgi:adenosylhomocysteine nucleosidase
VTLVIACGLKREARIIAAARGDVVTVIGGGSAGRLEQALTAAAAGGPGLILSCGIAGALVGTLGPGDLVIDGDDALVERVHAALPGTIVGQIAGSDSIVATAAAKRQLAQRSNAIAADMESHIAARVARQRGWSFGAIRAIADGATDDLPPAALIGMKPDGGMALGAVLRSLARQPGQLPALLRTGRQAGAAFGSLERAMRAALPAL